MTAIVIDTLRLSPVPSSEATYLSCMVSSSGLGSDQCSWWAAWALRSGLVAVDAARLVADHMARLQLDDPLAHLVDDAGIVGGHHHRRTRPVDPVEELHDADRRRRVKVS